VQANLGRKLKVRSTAGTLFFSTNMTRSHNKLQGIGQGPSGADLTSGGKLIAKPSCRAVRTCDMIVRSDTSSHWAGDQAVQTCQRGEGAKWIKVKPSKAELPNQTKLPNWAKVGLDCSFID